MSLITVVITTYGTLHGPAPAEGDALLIDLSDELRNPHRAPSMRYRTGLDPAARDHVLTTPGADRIVALNVDRIRALNTVHTPQVQPIITRVHIAGRGGRHRSVAVAEEIARELRREDIGTEVYHRDIDKPVYSADLP